MRRTHSRAILASLGVSVVCAGLAVWIATLAKADGSGGLDLAHVTRQFRLLDKLSVSALVEVVQSQNRPYDPGDPAPIGDCDGIVARPAFPVGTTQGHYEYVASGNRYWISSQLDPAKVPGLQTQVAYDGQSFQLLLSGGLLSIGRQDSASLLPIVNHPLLELIQFRYPLTDDNSRFHLRLQDIRQDTDPAGFFDVPWASVSEGGRMLDRAIFPGGTYEGLAYVHHVYAPPGEHHLPVRIDRVTNTYRVTSAEFCDYLRVDSASGPVFAPLLVVLRLFDANGEEQIHMSYTITHIGVDEPVNPDAFLINRELAQKIWDDEARVFLPD